MGRVRVWRAGKMIGKFIAKWHSRVGVGLTAYEGEKKVQINYDALVEDPFVVAEHRVRSELRRTFPCHIIVIDQLSQVRDF